jgi:sortase (surface protein transpeptidase)
VPVSAEDLDPYGVFPVPVDNQRRSMSWYREGGRAADLSGSVVLTAHSWTDGDSTGSKLLSSTPGDQLTVTRGSLKACYKVVSAESVSPARYAELLVERKLNMPAEGPHQLVIIVCDDYDPASQEWRKRRMIFAQLMK